jgi:hypothetical protein
MEGARRLFTMATRPLLLLPLKNRSVTTNTPMWLPEDRLAVTALFSR